MTSMSTIIVPHPVFVERHPSAVVGDQSIGPMFVAAAEARDEVAMTFMADGVALGELALGAAVRTNV